MLDAEDGVLPRQVPGFMIHLPARLEKREVLCSNEADLEDCRVQ